MISPILNFQIWFKFLYCKGLPLAGLSHLGLGMFLETGLGFLEFGVGQFVGREFAGHEGVVAREIHEAVAAVIEEDDLFLTFFFGLPGFLDGTGDRLAGLGWADEAFGSGPQEGGFIAFDLVDGRPRVRALDNSFDEARANAVVGE